MKRRVAKKQVRAIEAGMLPSAVWLWVTAPEEEWRDLASGLTEIALGMVLSFREMALFPRGARGAAVALERLELGPPSKLVGVGSVSWWPKTGDAEPLIESLRVEFDLSTLRKHRVCYALELGAASAT